MTAATESRRRTQSWLKRELAYYCGVVARTTSRERIHNADVIIRRRERQLKEAGDTPVRHGVAGD
jgi:hypothetical protein